MVPSCCICMEALSMPCTGLTKCGHIMHSSCLLQWQKRVGVNLTCPLCRSEAFVRRVGDELQGDVVALKFDVKLEDPLPQEELQALPSRTCACANGCVCFDDFDAVAAARGMASPPAQQQNWPLEDEEDEEEKEREGGGNSADSADSDNDDDEGNVIRRLEAAASTFSEKWQCGSCSFSHNSGAECEACGEPSPVVVKPEPDSALNDDPPSAPSPQAPHLLPAPPSMRIPAHVAIPRLKEALMIAYTRLSTANPAEVKKILKKVADLSGALLKEKQKSAREKETLTWKISSLQDELERLSSSTRTAEEEAAKAKEATWKLDGEHKKER